MNTDTLIAVVVLLVTAAAIALAADKPKPRPMLRFEGLVEAPQPEKVWGSYTMHEHTVHVISYDGTIDMELPRLGPDHPFEGTEKSSKREWPTKSPLYNNEQFWRWVGRVQRASDAGVLPDK
jgi:hypothetical protein